LCEWCIIAKTVDKSKLAEKCLWIPTVTTGEKYMVIHLDELSEILGITPKTIYNRLSANDDMPPPRKFGKKLIWLRKDVEEWLDNLPIAA